MSQPVARRAAYLVYGVACYAIFLVTFLYAIGFVGGFWRSLGLTGAPFRPMDSDPAQGGVLGALAVDALLLGLFALQHSGMARRGFKAAWTRLVPEPIERSTYVLATSLCLALLFWQWRPLGTAVVWDATGTAAEPALVALSLAGWLLVLVTTFLINHFDLFGLRQVWYAFRAQPYPGLEFRTPALYRAVRHPIYLGFIVAFWATPLMSLGHLVFAAATTGYILVAIQLEERDLVHRFGDVYREYRRSTRTLVPLPPARGEKRPERLQA